MTCPLCHTEIIKLSNSVGGLAWYTCECGRDETHERSQMENHGASQLTNLDGEKNEG